MHNVAVLDQKWWLGAFWLSGNRLLGEAWIVVHGLIGGWFRTRRPPPPAVGGVASVASPVPASFQQGGAPLWRPGFEAAEKSAPLTPPSVE